MIQAYDKNYLYKSQNNLGIMFDFVVYDLQENLSNFFEKFLDSKISKQFERGESSVIVGKSGIELSLEILNNSKLASKY